MIFCNKCGAQLADDAAFCPVCGTAKQAEQPQYAPAPAPVQQQYYQPQYAQRVESTPVSPVFFFGLFSAIAAFISLVAAIFGWVDPYMYYYGSFVNIGFGLIFLVSLAGLALGGIKPFKEQRINTVGKIMCLVCVITVLSIDFINLISFIVEMA